MPKCPKCGERIESLLYMVSGNMEYIVMVDETGIPTFLTPNFVPSGARNFFCPECGQWITSKLAEAVNFLETGKLESEQND